MTIPRLQGWWEELAPAINSLQQGAVELFNPSYKYQQALRESLAKDPTLLAKLGDMNAMSGGTMAQSAFGKGAMTDLISQQAPSLEAQRSMWLRDNPNLSPDNMPNTLLGESAGVALGLGTSDERKGKKITNRYNELGVKLREEELPYAATVAAATGAKAQETLDEVNKNRKYLAIADTVTQKYGGVQPLVKDMVGAILRGKPIKLTDEQRAALFSQKEFVTEFDRYMDAEQFKLSEQRAFAMMNNQRADQRELLARQEAYADAARAEKYGQSISGTKLYDIRKNNWENYINLYESKPEELKKINPQLYTLFKADPDYLNSWAGYKMAAEASQGQIQAGLLNRYNQAVNSLMTWASPAKGKKQPSQQEISARIATQLVPMQRHLQTLGVPAELPKFENESSWMGLANRAKLVNPTLGASSQSAPVGQSTPVSNDVKSVLDANVKNTGASKKTVADAALSQGVITKEQYDAYLASP